MANLQVIFKITMPQSLKLLKLKNEFNSKQMVLKLLVRLYLNFSVLKLKIL